MAVPAALPSVEGMAIAIITGASRGLGRALAAGLTGAGWDVVVDGRDARTLAAADLGDRAVRVPGDVTDPAHRAALVAAADRLGGADLLVNNAGILGPSPQPALADYPVGALREVFEVNLYAPLALTQLALPGLRKRGGAVLNVTSDAAVEPYPGWGGYGAAKAALEQASNVLAAEEADVRVWWADPGDLRTRMHQEAFPGEDIGDRPEPETVVPAVLRLLAARPASGRIKVASW
jgi:NAD(P)-dependent dehydrogenase (short-subunit alcohol dehydrogenase family)